MTPKYRAFRVVIHSPNDIERTQWVGEYNARNAYSLWRNALGKTALRVELWGKLQDGAEQVIECCDLRSDLHSSVKATPAPKAVQLPLFAEERTP